MRVKLRMTRTPKGRLPWLNCLTRTSINGMSLANRFVRSATWEGLADEDGAVTPRLIDMMVALARGEVGLIWRENV